MTVAEPVSPGIRVAIVVDGIPCPAWQGEVVARLAASGAASIVAIVGVAGAVDPSRAAGPALRLLATRLSKPRALRPSPADAMPGDVPVLRDRMERAGPKGGATLSEAGIASIRAGGADLVLWLSAAQPSGTILDAAPRGVWRLSFGTESAVTPSLVGCREHLAREAVVEARLLAQGAGHAPEVLRTGAFAVDPLSWARTRDRVLFGVAGWPALACRALQLGTLESIPASSQAPRASLGAAPAVRLVAGMASALGRRLWHHGFRHDDWNIGVVDAPVASFLAEGPPPKVAWAPVRAGHYAADPFGRWESDTLQVLFEDYVHARGAASLACRGWRRGEGWQPASPMLDVGTHQSYPFLLERDGRLWLLPESRAGKALVLYSADRVEGPWQPVTTLDVPGGVADATLLRHEDRWWLFAIRPDQRNPATELGLWFAEQLEGPWQEHPLSPVLSDVRWARPGGPFFTVDAQLYRPAQDCSTGYGDRLAIKRVTSLTPIHYAEELVRVVRPDPDDAFAFGLHTLTAVGDVTLVDGKRRVRDLGAIRASLRRRLGR